MIADTTFFTNEPGYTLLDRFKKTLKHLQYFDVLVGYFRTSGFHQLCESFESIDKKQTILLVQSKTTSIMNGKRIIALHGIRSKAKKISPKDRKVALDRKRDWLERNPV